jgi:tetrahydromethanopterin S-methyltransferase subunit G
MDGTLGTTNTMLAIMAAVSVLEALLLVGFGIAGFVLYRRTMALVGDLEARQIAPLREKVDAILGDVRAVTSRVSHQTERVDSAIADTMERVDETADRVKTRVREKVGRAVGVARGVRAVITTLLHDNGHEDRPHGTRATA